MGKVCLTKLQAGLQLSGILMRQCLVYLRFGTKKPGTQTCFSPGYGQFAEPRGSQLTAISVISSVTVGSVSASQLGRLRCWPHSLPQ
jgi:hypothetical protein